jgi:MFS family permease
MSKVVDLVAPPRMGTGFRWLLSSSWVSNLGDGIAIAAGPLLVASQTHDPILVALAGLLQRLPWLLFALYAGVVADRHDRKRIVFAVNIARTIVLGVLAITIVADAVNVAVVLTTMFVLGTTEAFSDITTGTLLPMLVDKPDLGVANARLGVGMITLNQLAGPPIGAFLSIDLIKKGADYGWPIREGTFALNPYGDLNKVYALPVDDTSDNITYPVAEYDHDEGKAPYGLVSTVLEESITKLESYRPRDRQAP